MMPVRRFAKRFTATGAETTVKLNAITGRRGSCLVWLNGRYLGTAKGGVEAGAESHNPDPGPGTFAIPPGLLAAGQPAVLSVLVGAAVPRSGPITWRIQGRRTGRPVRGSLNNGGLYGERDGWPLPGFADRAGRFFTALTFVDGALPTGHRVMIFLNGWNLGLYGGGTGR